MIKFSVIIPVYNVSEYLAETLDSVLHAIEVASKVYSDFLVEVIGINDGSTDESSEILNKYCSRVKVMHQENLGVSAARNAGLKSASGDWILFVDADDFVSENLFIELLSAIYEFKSVDLIRFGFARGNDRRNIYFANRDVKFKLVDISNSISNDEFFNYGMWCYCYSKKVVESIHFPQYSIGEDRLFLNAVQLKANMIAITDAALYGYRMRIGGATMSRHSIQKKLDELYARRDIFVMAAKNKRTINCLNNKFLSGYFLHEFLRNIYIYRGNVHQLLCEYQNALREVLKVNGFNCVGTLLAQIYLSPFVYLIISIEWLQWWIFHKQKEAQYSCYYIFGIKIYEHLRKSCKGQL